MEDELKEIKQLALNNAKEIKANADRIDKNFANIQNNSLALEILKDYKSDNNNLHNVAKWLIKVLVLVLVLWTATIVYLVYVLNDTGTIEETTTQEIVDVDSIGGNVINRGE